MSNASQNQNTRFQEAFREAVRKEDEIAMRHFLKRNPEISDRINKEGQEIVGSLKVNNNGSISGQEPSQQHQDDIKRVSFLRDTCDLETCAKESMNIDREMLDVSEEHKRLLNPNELDEDFNEDDLKYEKSFNFDSSNRKAYLKARSKLGPKEKYNYPTTSAWQYGWTQNANCQRNDNDDSHKDPKNNETNREFHGRVCHVKKTFFRRSGIF